MSSYDYDDPTGDVEAMAAELQQLRMEKARDEAIRLHPGAAPFRDLLIAGSQQAMNELAEDLASRVQGSGANAPTTYAGPPVIGSAAALPPAPNDAEELDALKREARESGNWTNILAHLRNRAQERAQRGF